MLQGHESDHEHHLHDDQIHDDPTNDHVMRDHVYHEIKRQQLFSQKGLRLLMVSMFDCMKQESREKKEKKEVLS